MSKKRKQVKVPDNKKSSSLNAKLGALHGRIEAIVDVITEMQRQTEITRIGLVTANNLNMDGEWTQTLRKTRDCMYGMLAFLKKKYPTILDEMTEALKDAPFQDIENVIGAMNAPVTYTEDDFRKKFDENISNAIKQIETRTENNVPHQSNSEPVPLQYADTQEDEDGTDEDVAEAMKKIANGDIDYKLWGTVNK